MSEGPEWFAPKRYGFGAGLPVSWQGWLVLLVYAATIIGAFFLFGEKSPATIAVLIIATAILLVVTSKTTRSGWRWRWGRSDE
jgi:hypothetical protein